MFTNSLLSALGIFVVVRLFGDVDMYDATLYAVLIGLISLVVQGQKKALIEEIKETLTKS